MFSFLLFWFYWTLLIDDSLPTLSAPLLIDSVTSTAGIHNKQNDND